MSTDRKLWLVSYDISDDRRRFAVARLLTEKLDRVQESVFEGFLSASEIDCLEKDIVNSIDLDVDKVTFFPICNWCERRLSIIGLGEKSTRSLFFFA